LENERLLKLHATVKRKAEPLIQVGSIEVVEKEIVPLQAAG
jgi:hypothetical protein